MLGDKKVTAVLAVRDMAAAKGFYEGKLGLKPSGGDEMGGESYDCGGATLFIYQSEHAGTNQATGASWSVGEDLAAIIEELKGKGVQFEHYDMPGTTMEGDVHVMGELKSAWFKDPDGNILNLVNQ